MKYCLIILFASIAFNVKAQAIRITVQEKTKEGLKPLADTKFEVTLNDSIKTELTSASDGMLGKLITGPGTYRIILTNPAFAPAETTNVIVVEKRLTAITMTCIPTTMIVPVEKKKNGK